MRAWVVIATTALFYTQAYGSADFGDKINSPMTTESPKLSDESSTEMTDRQESEHNEKARQVHSNDIVKLQKILKDVPENVGKSPIFSTPSPQVPFRQHIELANNVNSLYNGHDPLAALYEATRDAYVQSSRSNFYSNPAAIHFQPPTIPYNDVRPFLYSYPTAPHLLNQHIHVNHPPSPFHNRFLQPFQSNNVNNPIGTNYNNNDDYDDGSYDPYKYGDYLYFENNDDYYNQNYQKPHTSSKVIPAPHQQSHSFHDNPSSQLNNNYYQQNIQQQPQNVFPSANVQQQVHSPAHKKKNNLLSPKDVSKSLDDSYNYQIEAAKQYLKEIEEAQEYAKKVLSVSNSPPSHQYSQPMHDQNDYYDYQNPPTSFTNSEGRYNNFPLASSHYQQTARPSQQAPQPVEVNSIESHLNQETSQERDKHFVDGAEISSSHKEVRHGRKPYDVSSVSTPVPVLLPNGFLADTEEVRLAKMAHLQLVLDTLETVSSYKNNRPKQTPINAL